MSILGNILRYYGSFSNCINSFNAISYSLEIYYLAYFDFSHLSFMNTFNNSLHFGDYDSQMILN